MKKIVKNYNEFINESTNLKIDLNLIESDLKKFIKKNPDFDIDWGRIQNDEWDRDTKPYCIYSFEDFKKKWYTNPDKSKIKYALMRWIRHWCAKCDENIFCYKYSDPNPDIYDKEWDFVFNDLMGEYSGIKFDLKSTRIPKSLYEKRNYYKEHPEELIEWFYKYQSQESRKGYQNRLFLVHIPEGGESETQSRCDFDKKRKIVDEYYDSILNGNHNLYEMIIDGHKLISDIVFV